MATCHSNYSQASVASRVLGHQQQQKRGEREEEKNEMHSVSFINPQFIQMGNNEFSGRFGLLVILNPNYKLNQNVHCGIVLKLFQIIYFDVRKISLWLQSKLRIRFLHFNNKSKSVTIYWCIMCYLTKHDIFCEN